MPFQDYDYCLICEYIRPELGGKMTIMGFYGVAPNVEIVVRDVGQPVMLAFVAGFPPVVDRLATAYHNTISVSRPNGAVAFQTPPSPINVSATGRIVVAVGFALPPPQISGTHRIQMRVNGDLKMSAPFIIRTATAAEMAMISGTPFPVPPREIN